MEKLPQLGLQERDGWVHLSVPSLWVLVCWWFKFHLLFVFLSNFQPRFNSSYPGNNTDQLVQAAECFHLHKTFLCKLNTWINDGGNMGFVCDEMVRVRDPLNGRCWLPFTWLAVTATMKAFLCSLFTLSLAWATTSPADFLGQSSTGHFRNSGPFCHNDPSPRSFA